MTLHVHITLLGDVPVTVFLLFSQDPGKIVAAGVKL